jgi:hypothetical protein
MGVRHFDIASHGLTANQSKKIAMFFDRVKDICTLNLIQIPGTASGSADSMLAASAAPSALKWHLQLTDRQFLCLYKPLSEILVEASTATLIFPSCTYNGFDPAASVSFWPQTDEQLIYRTEVNYRKTISLFSSTRPSVAMLSNAAYIADFVTMEKAISYTSTMIKDQLPIMHIIIPSIQHACLRGQSHFSNGTVVPATIKDVHEETLAFFAERAAFNINIRFGKDYIFVPVEKSGCSTIARALGSLEAGRLIDFAAYKELHMFPLEVKERYQNLLSPAIFKFTCARNPFSRALSAYLDKIMGDEIERAPYRADLGFSNDEAVSFLDFLTKLKEKGLSVASHFNVQCNVMMCPYVHYNMIVKLENFDQDFQIVMNRLGISGEPKNYKWAPHATSAKSKLSEYYTQKCVDLVVEIYNRDFQFLNYSTIPSFTLKVD